MLYYSLYYYYETKFNESYGTEEQINWTKCSLYRTYYVVNCCDN